MSKLRASTLCPHKAPLTEENLPDQSGKVFIVTGGSSGIGKELVKILYQHNARVYIATRSQKTVEEAIEEISGLFPQSRGSLHFLKLVLDDLTTIKESAMQFLAQETRLDVLWNNAGVMHPPKGSKTVQGYELQQGVNALGHFLFVKFLTPLIIETAKTAPARSVRIIWVSSMSADFAPVPAIDFDNMDYAKEESIENQYHRSKSGNLIHAAEFGRKYRDTGVLSVSMNPGLLQTNLQRNFSMAQGFMVKMAGKPPKFGAYTELFAGLDQSITQDDLWITPFGHREEPREDIIEPEQCRKYWEWSEAQVRPYL